MSARRVRSRPPVPPRRRPIRFDVLEARQLLAVFDVSSLADSGNGTLRQAILDSNASPGFNFIDFTTSGEIALASPLPTITSPVRIDGYSASDSSTNPTTKTDVDIADATIQIDGTGAGDGAIGLDIQSPNCTIDGLAITDFAGPGISISGAGSQGNWLYGNFIGTLPNVNEGRDFPTGVGNQGAGIVITSSNNRVGGNDPSLRNVIAYNEIGISIAGSGGTGNLVENNFILDNAQQGVLVASSNNTIGEDLSGGGNVISGNGAQGVEVLGDGGPDVQGNLILGNEVGTDIGVGVVILTQPRGFAPLPNGDVGVLIDDSPNNTVGGSDSDARNIIGGNISDGLSIEGAGAVNNLVQGNYIGFNIVNGVETFAIANHDGIIVTSADNTIGGTATGAGNTINNNRNHGIELDGSTASGNAIQGNIIGLNPSGGSSFGNAEDGIHLDGAPNNTIGGAASGAGNTISANNNGIVILNLGATGNIVQGNLIGTGTDGVTDLGNAVDGVVVNQAPRNTIGGTTSGAGNVISGNNTGVYLTGAGTQGDLVQGNFIGTDRTATQPVGNEVDGVLVDQGAAQDTIGGLAPGAGNAIAYNAGIGVEIDSGTGDPILTNSIFSNTKLGIDLGGDGVTPNDPGDGDTGPNNLQNYPVLTAAAPAGSSTDVQGTFNSTPGATFTIQFFASPTKDPSGYGQGETYIGSTTVTTDDSGNASFNVVLPSAVPSGEFVTATATDAGNDTSEFSNAIPSQPVSVEFLNATYSVAEGNGDATIDVVRTGGTGGQVIVTFATGGGTAIAGTDYTPVNTQVIFEPGETDKTVTIPILADPNAQTNLTVGLALSSPNNGATLGAPATATLTIDVNGQGSGSTSNAPTLSAATSFPGHTEIQGQLNGATAGQADTVTFFANIPGQSPQEIGSIQVQATGATTPFVADLPATVPLGDTITAETTDPSNNVSSLSPAVTVVSAFLVTNTADSGIGSLRQAILNANANPGLDTIGFAIGSGALFTISPLSPLPTITDPVIIDGYSEVGASPNPSTDTDIDIAALTVQIDGASAGAGAIGLNIQAPNCTIDGLAITDFSGAGISISGANSQGNWIWGDALGTLSNTTADRTYPVGLGNGVGLAISASNNRVGGSNPGLRDVIYGNTVGVLLSGSQGTGNLIENDFILDNAQQGVIVASSNNTIGEALTGGGDVISGNGAQGIEITGGPGVRGNQVLGDEIGTDIGYGQSGPDVRTRGEDARPNGVNGILIEDSPYNTIGGLTTEARNIIAANNSDGVLIDGSASVGNVLQGNYIGFNITGNLEALLPNADGVRITAPGNTIGGATTAAQNSIDNNHANGVELDGAGASGNVIEGNIIGLNPDGGSNFGNTLDGIHIEGAPNNTIGGTTTGQRNVISGNNNGIVIANAGATGNVIEGNFIGTATDGVTDLGNAVDGVQVQNAARNTIGGLVSGAGNVISGNNNGVHLTGGGTLGNLIQGNFIGTDLTAQLPVGNSIAGVLVDEGASQNTIGGTDSGAGNTIAFNAGAGVEIDSGTGNPILTNSIVSNAKLGIDLGGDGVTPNHAGGSSSGPNDWENYPVLTAVAPFNGTTNVQGTYNGNPGRTVTLQFFSVPVKDPSGYGQGQTYLGSTGVTTDGDGNATFNVNLPVTVASGQFVTATATDPTNGTSEFSNDLPGVPVSVQLGASTYAVNETDGVATVSVTRTGGTGGQVVVNLATGGGTAAPGTDYTPVNTLVTFQPGETTKTVTIPILNPGRVDTSETVGLALSSPNNGATLGSPASAVLTINDNEPATIQFGAGTYNTTESAGSVAITVTRDSGDGTATVAYATGGGPAVPGVDYTPVSGTLTFNPGQTSQTIRVPILDNGHLEDTEAFGVTLGSPNGAVLGSPSGTVVVIAAHDQAGVIQFGAPLFNAVATTGAATVTVTRTGGSDGQVSVVYATGGGNAQPGVDYTPTFGTLTFQPGQVSQTITLPVAANRAGLPVAFGLYLAPPTGGAALGNPAAAAVVVPGSGIAAASANPSGPGPVVENYSLVTGPSGIIALDFQFSAPMDPARAQNVANYGFFVISAGPDGVFGDGDDSSIPIAAVSYNPSTAQAIVATATPLPPNAMYQVVLNQNASALLGTGLADVNGNLLDGDGNGVAGGAYVARFGQGASLRYTDNTGNVVSLQLTSGGLIDLALAPDGVAESLALQGTRPGRSTLTGSVRRGQPGASGHTTLPPIAGASGVRIKLKASQFTVGVLSAEAVDAVLGSGHASLKPRG